MKKWGIDAIGAQLMPLEFQIDALPSRHIQRLERASQKCRIYHESSRGTHRYDQRFVPAHFAHHQCDVFAGPPGLLECLA